MTNKPHTVWALLSLQVLVAGLPCIVQTGSATATTLSCVPSLAGQLLAGAKRHLQLAR